MNRLIASLILMALIVTALPMPKASALESQQIGYLLEASTGPHLSDSEWCNAQGKHLSWPTALSTCNTGGGVVSGFNKTSSSYVIFRSLEPTPRLNDGSGHTLNTNRYQLFIAQPNKKITFYRGLDANGALQYYFTSDDYITKAEIRAEPNTDPDYKYNWTGSFSSGQYYSTSTSIFSPSTVNGGRGFVIGNDLYDSQVGAINTTYAESWDLGQFSKTVPYGEDGNANCGTMDIGCWVGKITSGFTTGIKELFGLMVDGFSWLFIPDGKVVKAQFDTSNALMTAHLGFLSYPFTFLGDFYNSFNSTSSWCNDTSCTKHLGNVMGSDFTLNLGAMQRMTPTIWTFMTLALRGIAVIMLIFTLRAKYMEVVTR